MKFFVFFIVSSLLTATASLQQAANFSIEVHSLDAFGKLGKLALHFPCVESNMFATKCACHLRCDGQNCNKAIELCSKYQKSVGCKYVLTRGFRNKIATLKRAPSPEETAMLSIEEFKVGIRKAQPMPSTQTLGDFIQTAGALGEEVLNQLSMPKRSPLCPGLPFVRAANESIALVVISYRSPMSLANTMRSWMKSGLLQMVSERIALLSDPLPEEINMALYHGFTVVQPKDIPGAKVIKSNVFTIGAAFYYAMKIVKSEFVLFMENDFKMDISLNEATVKAELLAATGLLNRGTQLVRLLSLKSQGCGTFKDCDHHGFHLTNPDPSARLRNWFAFYCPGKANTDDLVSDCLTGSVRYRCFTSWDSNWSLNAVLVRRRAMLDKKYPSTKGHLSLAEIGLSHWQRQDGFETDMAHESKWMTWKVPICISYNGLFIHEEIETGS